MMRFSWLCYSYYRSRRRSPNYVKVLAEGRSRRRLQDLHHNDWIKAALFYWAEILRNWLLNKNSNLKNSRAWLACSFDKVKCNAKVQTVDRPLTTRSGNSLTKKNLTLPVRSWRTSIIAPPLQSNYQFHYMDGKKRIWIISFLDCIQGNRNLGRQVVRQGKAGAGGKPLSQLLTKKKIPR